MSNKISLLDTKLNVKKAFEFTIKYNEESKVKHTMKIIFDFSGVSIDTILGTFARRAIVVRFQNSLRPKAKNEEEFTRMVEQYNGKVVRVADLLVERRVDKEKTSDRAKKEISKLKKLGLSKEEILKLLDL